MVEGCHILYHIDWCCDQLLIFPIPLTPVLHWILCFDWCARHWCVVRLIIDFLISLVFLDKFPTINRLIKYLYWRTGFKMSWSFFRPYGKAEIPCVQVVNCSQRRHHRRPTSRSMWISSCKMEYFVLNFRCSELIYQFFIAYIFSVLWISICLTTWSPSRRRVITSPQYPSATISHRAHWVPCAQWFLFVSKRSLRVSWRILTDVRWN